MRAAALALLLGGMLSACVTDRPIPLYTITCHTPEGDKVFRNVPWTRFNISRDGTWVYNPEGNEGSAHFSPHVRCEAIQSGWRG